MRNLWTKKMNKAAEKWRWKLWYHDKSHACHEWMNVNGREKKRRKWKSGREKNGERKKLVDIILDNAQISKTHSLHEYIVSYIT